MHLLIVFDSDNSCVVTFDETKGSIFQDISILLNKDYQKNTSSTKWFGPITRKTEEGKVICQYTIHYFEWINENIYKANDLANTFYKNLHPSELNETIDTSLIRGPIFISKELKGSFKDINSEDTNWLFDHFALLTTKPKKSSCILS